MDLNRLVLGTAGIGGIWGAVSGEESVETVLVALRSGITAIDTAPAYGHAETYVGQALRQWNGPRPAVSSKVGRLQGFAASDGRYDYSRAAMFRSVEASLERLGVEQLDVLFLHDPAHIAEEDFSAVVSTLQALQAAGYARAIGLGGNPPVQAWPLLRQGVFHVLMEYNRLNAGEAPALETSLPDCILHGVRYYAASPLYMGLLGKSFTAFNNAPPAWLPPRAMHTARRLQQLAGEQGITMPSMAHRFLLSVPYDFNIVIGPSNTAELADTLADFAAGPLPGGLFERILYQSKETHP